MDESRQRPAYNERKSRCRSNRAFTIIELLIVIAIIGVMLALLMPALQSSREAARRTQCSNTLRQIGLTTLQYHDLYKRWPDASITGNFSFRMAPGMRTPNDPGALPERFGLQAEFERRNLLNDGNLWICPSAPDWMQAYRNTYAFSIAAILKRRQIEDKKSVLWVWDNFSLYPGLSGFRGPFSSYTVKTADRRDPHGPLLKGYNALWLDGHVEFKRLD